MEKYKIKDICTILNGRAYKYEELQDSGKYRILRVGNFFSKDDWYYSDMELDDNKYCYDGDLLYAWSANFGPKIWEGEKKQYIIIIFGKLFLMKMQIKCFYIINYIVLQID